MHQSWLYADQLGTLKARTMNADREFLFEYRFAGAVWSITIHATDPAEASEKIKAAGMARYHGEIFAKIPAAVPGSSLWIRLLCWWKNRGKGNG